MNEVAVGYSDRGISTLCRKRNFIRCLSSSHFFTLTLCRIIIASNSNHGHLDGQPFATNPAATMPGNTLRGTIPRPLSRMVDPAESQSQTIQEDVSLWEQNVSECTGVYYVNPCILSQHIILIIVCFWFSCKRWYLRVMLQFIAWFPVVSELVPFIIAGIQSHCTSGIWYLHIISYDSLLQ